MHTQGWSGRESLEQPFVVRVQVVNCRGDACIFWFLPDFQCHVFVQRPWLCTCARAQHTHTHTTCAVVCSMPGGALRRRLLGPVPCVQDCTRRAGVCVGLLYFCGWVCCVSAACASSICNVLVWLGLLCAHGLCKGRFIHSNVLHSRVQVQSDWGKGEHPSPLSKL
jgi:hypothetical protein